MTAEKKQQHAVPQVLVNFATSGLGGMMGWVVIHPVNTLAVRMNLANASGNAGNLTVLAYVNQVVKSGGLWSLYDGLPAGLMKQVFYSTSRFGLFEVMRDEAAKYRPTDIWSRLGVGVVSGGCAAVISCPAEVTLVRMTNDASLPVAARRNYRGVLDAFYRILKEEGVKTFFSGSGPFVNRAMLVGAVQVGTYDEFRSIYRRKLGIVDPLVNVLCASFTSGMIYSIVTNPFETAKNRMVSPLALFPRSTCVVCVNTEPCLLPPRPPPRDTPCASPHIAPSPVTVRQAFQKPDAVTGIKPYRSTVQTITDIATKEGVLKLWAGFPPYYVRCGGHTVLMFLAVEWLRKMYDLYAS